MARIMRPQDGGWLQDLSRFAHYMQERIEATRRSSNCPEFSASCFAPLTYYLPARYSAADLMRCISW